jgi:hypothetical protein
MRTNLITLFQVQQAVNIGYCTAYGSENLAKVHNYVSFGTLYSQLALTSPQHATRLCQARVSDGLSVCRLHINIPSWLLVHQILSSTPRRHHISTAQWSGWRRKMATRRPSLSTPRRSGYGRKWSSSPVSVKTNYGCAVLCEQERRCK